MGRDKYIIHPDWKKWAAGIGVVFLAAELFYLLAANFLLNTSWGPRMATRHPQKLDVKWDSGYTLYPGQVVLSGFNMRFQKNRNKWFLRADRVKGHISLIRLFWRHFHVSRMNAEGVSYRYMRLKEPVPDPAPNRPHWLISMDSLVVQSIHSLETDDYRLTGVARASGSLRYVTRRELEVFRFELKLTEGVLIRNGTVVASDVDLGVHFRTEPFVPSVDKGRRALQHITAGVRVEAETEMLRKPMALFKRLPWLEIRKSGRFSADLRFEKGLFLEGSRLGVSDMEIRSRYRDLLVRGTGSVYAILADPVQDLEDIRRANLEILFKQYQLDRDGVNVPLVTGEGFHVLLASERLNLKRTAEIPGFNITIDMPRSRVSDVRALNSYLDRWEMFSFEHGDALISAQISFDHESGKGKGKIELASETLGVVIQGHPLSGNFYFQTDVREFDPGDPGFLFSAELNLEDSGRHWRFDVSLSDGVLDWPTPYLEMGGKKVLSEASGHCGLAGDVSDIGFLNAFFADQHGLKLNGPGTLNGKLLLKKGKLIEGTRFRFEVPDIQARLLGYRANGNASLSAAIHENGRSERGYRMDLGLVIHDYSVKLDGMKGVHSGGKTLQADLQIPSLKLDGSVPSVELRIEMPENIIYDMRTYNYLWGEDAAFQIVKGSGTSRGTFTFSGGSQSMEGRLMVRAPETKAVVDGIPITAELKFEGRLASENVDEKTFNLAGSQLTLNNVYVGAENPEDGWKMLCQLENTEIHWDKPLRISGEMNMTMTDSTPIVSFFVEQHDFLKYFSGLFDVTDIRGRGRFHLNENYLDVKQLEISGDVLEIQGKLRMNNEFKRGALLVYFHKLPLLVTMEDGKKRPHLFGARKKFEEFDAFAEKDTGNSDRE